MILNRDIFVQYRSINSEKYIVKNNNVFQLDEVGEIVWESLDGNISVDQIVDKVAHKYNVDRNIVLNDIQEFVKELIKNNLVEELG